MGIYLSVGKSDFKVSIRFTAREKDILRRAKMENETLYDAEGRRWGLPLSDFMEGKDYYFGRRHDMSGGEAFGMYQRFLDWHSDRLQARIKDLERQFLAAGISLADDMTVYPDRKTLTIPHDIPHDVPHPIQQPTPYTVRKMEASIERKPHTYTTWFGLGKEKQSGSDIIVTAHFSEVEKEIIKRGALHDYVVYEYPIDPVVYADWEAAREKWLREGQGAGGYLGSCKTFPGAIPSLLVSNFLQAPTQAIHPGWKWQDDVSMMNTENEIEENFKKLRTLIEAVEQHPTGKRTLDL